MTSQLSYSELFYLFFFVPSTLNLKNNSRKSTNKKIWPNIGAQWGIDMITFLFVKVLGKYSFVNSNRNTAIVRVAVGFRTQYG